MKIVAVFVILVASCCMEVSFAAPSLQWSMDKRHAQEQEPTAAEEEKPMEDSESGTTDEKPTEEETQEEEEKDAEAEGDDSQDEQGKDCHHYQLENGHGDEGVKSENDQGQADAEESAK